MILKKLNIQYPIIQAPMAGGVSTIDMASKVSDYGGLGSIAGGHLSTEELKKKIEEFRAITDAPVNINLFIPATINDVDKDRTILAKNNLSELYDSLGVAQQPFKLGDLRREFNQKVELILEYKMPICSFTFGLPPNSVIERLKEAGVFIMATANSLREALAMEKAGMDAIILQGIEAGGFRGGEIDTDIMGLFSLIPQCRSRLTIPIIATGGIMDRRGIDAALMLGADAVQMGTAFLLADESGAPQFHKDQLLKENDRPMVLSRSVAGRNAQGLQNHFIESLKLNNLYADYPAQMILTTPLMKRAKELEASEYYPLWGGQSAVMGREQSVESLMKSLTTSPD